MKRILIMVLTALALLSCMKEEMEGPQPEMEVGPGICFEALTETGAAKTALDTKDGSVKWTAGDKVKFLWNLDGTYGSAESEALTASAISGNLATFTVEAPEAFKQTEYAGTRALYAVSPSSVVSSYEAGALTVTVPSSQDGKFSSANIAVAHWNAVYPGAALQFKNLCGLLQVTVPSASTMSDAAKIRVTASTDIAGKAVVEYVDGVPVVKSYTDGAKKIVASISGKGVYYIAMLPMGADDVKVEILNASNAVIGNVFKAASLPMKRSVIRRAGEVAPTTVLGEAADVTALMRLRPGKLIGVTQAASTSVCNRIIKAGESFDIMLSDETVFGSETSVTITDADQEDLFVKAQAGIQATGAEIWGVHLPYRGNVAIESTTASVRTNALNRQYKLIEFSLKYLQPKHFVIHPGSSSIYTDDSDYATCKKNSQDCMVKIQAKLDELNAKYGTDAILCVENCCRNIAYDAASMLDYLSYPGLENTRICLDTGHALVPLNGVYVNSDRTLKKTGDVVAMLRQMGTRLGTLHIQQNKGELENKSYDTHLQPFAGGLIDWGEFYRVLLEDCQYRGCFLYEVEYKTKHGDNNDKANIESVASNYQNVIYTEYLK